MLPVIDGAVVTMDLEGGEASGSGGWNEYFGSHTLEGQSLGIDVGGSTQKACDPAVMAQEKLFLEALGRTCTWIGEGLELRPVDDQGVFVITNLLQLQAAGLPG